MWRSILAVIVGYIAMVVVVVIGFRIAWIVLGAAVALEPGTWEATTTWIVTTSGIAIVGAIGGGLVCAVIARPGSRAARALAALILVLGAGLGVFAFMSRDEGPPSVRESDEITWQEAMQNGPQPVLTLVLNPLIGAVGVLIGAKLRGGKKSAAAPPGQVIPSGSSHADQVS